MENHGTTVAVILFAAFLLVCLVLILRMFFYLLQLGDERRQAIVGKACTFSFSGTVGYLLFAILRSMFHKDSILINPLVTLIAAAVLFTISLGWYKRKLGG